jgi:sulfur-carrier protein adenylyltransferase/sulfurtransferase
VGRVGLADGDTVDLSNLQRQILHGTGRVGDRKADSARDALRAVNPEITVETYPVRLTAANAREILASYDVIVDGTDNFSARYLLNDACALLGKPLVHGAIYRFEGQVSVFDARRGPCYRCLFPEPPPAAPSCAEAGVLGVLPGTVGCLQATEAIKLALGVGEPLVGRLLLFDALALRFRELKITKHRDCPLCGDRPTITGLTDLAPTCDANPKEPQTMDTIPEISPAELKAKLDRGDDFTLLDVREPDEFAFARIPGATLIPLGTLPGRLAELDPDAEIVVQCRSGKRSAQALVFLKQQGFTNVTNLRGGILAWSDEVDPSVPKY